MEKHFGLIGQSLKHSFSQNFFTEYFEKKSISAAYQNVELENADDLHAFFQKDIFNFSGLNVTIPYKEIVIPFLTTLTPEAQAIGAVNTIKIVDNQLIGHNTDAFGFHQSIKPFLTNQHEKALIFGTGGASKAVAYVLKKIGIEVLYVSQSKTGNLIFPYDAVNEYMLKACKLLVNTTPIGMFPNVHESIDIPYHFLTPEHLVVDLIYNPKETQFLQQAKNQNSMTLNGLTMLKEQALESWKFWNDDHA
ncbi:MAG TPA: shikimate dehydrogenase [Crocinitomicaceae bacterium]|nr:shikimate dehydrogenase [Crocinitomicaceae bacterium]